MKCFLWALLNFKLLSFFVNENLFIVFRTVRTWEVENPRKQRSVFKPRTMQGKKVIPTTCTYSRDGNLIAAACQNGSIQIWDRNMTVSLRHLSLLFLEEKHLIKTNIMLKYYEGQFPEFSPNLNFSVSW